MTGAILHVFNDALMTFCLFLAMGNLAYMLKNLDMDNLKGLFAKMPVTMTCLVAGGLSVVGIPPTCGFFSKWYLISGAVQAGQHSFLVALLLSSLINAFLFFRIIEKAYFEPMAEGHAHGAHSGHGPTVAVQEAPMSMLIPLGAVGAGLIITGLYSGVIVRNIIVPFLPASLL
jgi:multicomponent Na+:H+ antiporter subunit D